MATIDRKELYNRELVTRMSPSIQSEEEPIVVPERLSSPHLLVKQSSEILNGRQPNDVGLVNPPKIRMP